MQPDLATLTCWVRALEPETGVAFAGSVQAGVYHTPVCRTVPRGVGEASAIPFTDITAFCRVCVNDTEPVFTWIVDPTHRRLLETFHALHTISHDDRDVERVTAEILLERTGHELSTTMIVIDLAEHFDTTERAVRGYAVEIGAAYNDIAAELVADALDSIEQQRDTHLRDPGRVDALRSEVAELYGVLPDDTIVICGVDTAALGAAAHAAVERLREHPVSSFEEENWQSREPVVHLLVCEALEAVFVNNNGGPRQVLHLPRWVYDAIVLLCGPSVLSSAYVDLDPTVQMTATTLWLEAASPSDSTPDRGVYTRFDACVAAAELL